MKVITVTEHNAQSSYRFEFANVQDLQNFINAALKPAADAMGFEITMKKKADKQSDVRGEVGTV